MDIKSTLLVDIGQRLYKERKNLGVTQAQIAYELGISPQWYGKVERGNSRPSIEMLIILFEKYDIDPTYLITGKTSPSAVLDKIVEGCPADKRFHIETIVRSAKALCVDSAHD